MAESEEIMDVSLGTKPRNTPTKEVTPMPLKAPRSRMDMSREASLRTKEEMIAHHQNTSYRINTCATYIPQEYIPEGYQVLWTRRRVKSYEDPRNIARLEAEGWEYVYADEMPQYSMGADADSLVSCDNGGLVLMKRMNEIHSIYQDRRARERDLQSRVSEGVRSIDAELHPFASSQNWKKSNDSFFPSDDLANSFATNFRQ